MKKVSSDGETNKNETANIRLLVRMHSTVKDGVRDFSKYD